MIVECYKCEALVDAKVIGTHESYDGDEDPEPFKAFLLACPKCKNSLLGGNYISEPDPLTRLWPKPDRYISWSIPDIIRSSIEEAIRCFKGGAYTASVAMCGRALEGMCRHFKTKNPYLNGGLAELKQNQVIDQRLYEWAEALRELRNKAAHATGERLSKKDAEDMLAFVRAIGEYVFVLTEQYARFVKRRGDAEKK